MGRAQGGPRATGGVDPRRLLSVSNPLLSGRDLKLQTRVDAPSMRPPWASVLSDSDYLELAHELTTRNPAPAGRAANLNFVLTSPTLWDPSSPKQKHYHGHIAIDGNQFCAVTTNGPANAPHMQAKVWLRSPSLRECLRVLTDQLLAKQNGGGSSVYVPKNGGPPVTVDADAFDRAFRAAAGR